MRSVDHPLSAEPEVPEDPTVPAEERRFYIEEFRGATIVVSLPSVDDAVVEALGRASRSLAEGGGQLLLVVAEDELSPLVATVLTDPTVLVGPDGAVTPGWLAEVWLGIADGGEVVVTTPTDRVAAVAADLAAALAARKLVLTDPDGGWGRPPRSFVDVLTHAEAMVEQLTRRQGGRVVQAITAALAGGVTNVNLCRPADLDRELFTFDGTGSLFTSGGYLELDRLKVDDLPAVEGLLRQGVADGLLRPRTRLEVAHLAVTGLGARVRGSGQLAGIVSLETAPYVADRLGEVAALYTVSRFSGSGAGGLLVDGLASRAEADPALDAIFAVTVSDAAAAFFQRKGFLEVGQEEIPATKWAAYDAARRARARVFLRSTPST